MSMRNRNCAVIPPQQGFTMVELMVAMLISLLLMGGVIQVFSSSSKSYRNVEGLSRIQENGRFAMEFLSRDIRMGDFWGCANNATKVTNSLGGALWQHDFVAAGVSNGIVGTEGGANPDSIILRSAAGSGFTVQLPYGPGISSDVTIPPNSGLAPGDLVVISDCQLADIVQITSTVAEIAAGTLKHDTTGSPGNTTANLTKIYGADGQVYPVRSIRYTIATNLVTGQPGLYRDTGTGAQELVDGIVDMQLFYGEDTDADGTANYYVPANSIAVMENVVSVRIWLVLQSYEDNLTATPMSYTVNGVATTAGDNRLYQVFNSTVTVRNRVQ